MPFRKSPKGGYTHKGRHYSAKQVRAYYATGGFKRAPRKKRK